MTYLTIVGCLVVMIAVVYLELRILMWADRKMTEPRVRIVRK